MTKSRMLDIANHLCRESPGYNRSLRFSIFRAGILLAGVGMGGFFWPPSLGVSLLKALLRYSASGPPAGLPSVLPSRLGIGRSPHADRLLNVKKIFGNTHDVFQIE